MKTFIKTSALVVAFGLFAASTFANEAPAKKAKVAVKEDVVLFTSMDSDCGVGVIVHKAESGKAQIEIIDANNQVVLKDVTSKGTDAVLKGYVLSNLKNGDYAFKVTTGSKEVKRNIRIFTDENNQKSFVFML